MKFIPIKTRPILPPQEDIFEIFDEYLPELKEGDIVFITSKVLAIHQWRCIPVEGIDKQALIESEAEKIMPPYSFQWYNFTLTIKDHCLIPFAGIDESNANDHYILRPENIQEITQQLRSWLRKKYQLEKLGVIITDSVTQMLRRWTHGKALWWRGIESLKDYIGEKDIFGKSMQYTQQNLIDPLASMAVYIMGEGNEQIPLVIGRDIPQVSYTDQDSYTDTIIDPEGDLYQPFVSLFK